MLISAVVPSGMNELLCQSGVTQMAVAPRNSIRQAAAGCHEFMVTALKSHMAGLLGRAAACARHRSETRGRPAGVLAQQAPRRDLRREVLAIERRAQLAAER